ncbi:MAG: hypothetical protein ACREBD_07500 [Blastocatellia bacterium]
MSNRKIINASLYFCLLVSAACGARLYKVAPLPTAAPPEFSSNSTNGFSVGAVVLDGEQSLERFEANLPLAGVIAVDLRMANNTAETIRANAIKFELRDSSGAKLKRLAPKKALGAVMKYYGDRFYAKSAHRRTLDDYESVALKTNTPIAPREERRGIVFFQTQRNTTNVNGLTLSVTGLPAPINLQLQTASD